MGVAMNNILPSISPPPIPPPITRTTPRVVSYEGVMSVGPLDLCEFEGVNMLSEILCEM